MKISFLLRAVLAVNIVAVGIIWPASAQAALKRAKYAVLDYDVVYVRCPRGQEPIIRPDGRDQQFLNWNGVNDLWLSASNNIYQQPGCDLVLHHSDPGYKKLPLGDPGREEVLVDCNEQDTGKPVCTVADPNVSFDGRSVVYTKFTDIRHILKDDGISGDGGVGATKHKQAFPTGASTLPATGTAAISSFNCSSWIGTGAIWNYWDIARFPSSCIPQY